MAIEFGKIFDSLSPIAKDILTSFAKKGTTDNVTWLAQTFAGNEHTARDAQSLTEEVYSTIGRFSANMRNIEKDCAIGKTKEQWLKNFIESNVNLTPQEKGEYLFQANAALNLGNQVMSTTMESPQMINITEEVNRLMQQNLPSANPNAQWNRYTMAPVINEIGQQAMLMGVNSVMMPIPQMPVEEVLPQDVTEEERGSLVEEGLKMAAAAAIKIGQTTGKISFLSKAMPVSAITNIACVGIESFKNIGRVATGKISPLQAVENVGRASVAAVADFFTTGIPARLLAPIPVVGPALSVMVVGYFSDGRLLNWLRARYYDDEADKVEQLTANDPQLHKKLCAIFGVESEEDVDPEEIARRQERLKKLKQYTADREILERVNQVAFDQEELSDLLDEDERRDDSSRADDLFVEGLVARYGDDEDYETALEKFKEAAEFGYPPAFDEIGRIYYFGDGVPKDIDEARRWFKLGMVKDNGDCFGGYAMTIVNDRDASESDKREAFRYMKRATELNPEDGVWWHQLGLMYRFGNGTKKNLEEAFSCFKQGNKFGNSYATNQLGIMFSNGEHVEQNFRKAFNFFTRAVELDKSNVHALNNLASCYLDGDGCDEDIYKAFELYLKAAELGNINAMTTVGYMLFNGDGTREDKRESFKWTKKAAEAGDLNAMNNLAYDYLNGYGTSKNSSKAIEWYTKAAKAGDASAMNELGWIYEQGEIIREDSPVAFDWYRKSAEAGNFEGMANLGACYLYGYGVKKDMYEAERWLKNSADGGSLRGMYHYGNYLCETGDTRTAIGWFERAANEGLKIAQDRLDELRDESSQPSGGVWEATTMIRNRQGLHTRPASIFVQKAISFKSKIHLRTANGKTVDAKSILMIMCLGLTYGDQVTILADGPDARQAVNELRNLIDSGFGE